MEIEALSDARNARRSDGLGVFGPCAAGWNAMPSPCANVLNLPWRRRWKGSSTAAKDASSPCAPTIVPMLSIANPCTCSAALLVRSDCEITDEKKGKVSAGNAGTVGRGPAMKTTPAPEVLAEPNATHWRSPLVATNDVSV